MAVKGDVAGRMAGRFEDTEGEPGFFYGYRIAFADHAQISGHPRVIRSPGGRRMTSANLVYAADVIMVVMGQQQTAKQEVVSFKESQRSGRFSRIHDHAVPAVVNSPDIIVAECLDCLDLDVH